MTDADLARLLAATAASLDERDASFSAGIVRVASRRLAQLARQREVSTIVDIACPWCGGDVQQPSTGRPRVYCSTRCRNATVRKVRNATLAVSSDWSRDDNDD